MPPLLLSSRISPSGPASGAVEADLDDGVATGVDTGVEVDDVVAGAGDVLPCVRSAEI